MLENIPYSLQRLTTLGDISSAQKVVKDEDYFQLKRDYQNLVNAVSALLVAINGGEFSPIYGSGSPEGVVAANYSQWYVNSDSAQIYFNPTYGEKTGWIATA